LAAFQRAINRAGFKLRFASRPRTLLWKSGVTPEPERVLGQPGKSLKLQTSSAAPLRGQQLVEFSAYGLQRAP